MQASLEGVNPKTRQKVVVLGWTCLPGPSTRGKSQNDLEQLPSTGLQPPSTTQFGCSPAKECPVSPAGRPCGHFRKPCAKTFGERYALQGCQEGVLSPNAAKLASLVTNVPCRPLCEGYFHQTILNNSMSTQKCISIVHYRYRLLPSSSAQPSPNHSFRLSPSLYLPASVVRYFLM